MLGTIKLVDYLHKNNDAIETGGHKLVFYVGLYTFTFYALEDTFEVMYNYETRQYKKSELTISEAKLILRILDLQY